MHGGGNNSYFCFRIDATDCSRMAEHEADRNNVSLGDWEQSKENFAPVRQGRQAKAMAEIPDAADSATKQSLEKKRRWGLSCCHAHCTQ